MRGPVIACALLFALSFASRALADDAQKRKAADRVFQLGKRAYHAQNFAAAAEHWEEAYKILPLPEIAFSAAQAYRRQYRRDPRIELAKRAVELYTIYLRESQTGAQAGMAADYIDTMEREVMKLTAAGAKAVAAASGERTTLVINPELATEGTGGDAIREIADAPEAETGRVLAFLDGKPVQPFEKIDVEPGPHKLRVEAEGYLPAEASERAVKGVSVVANITLVPKPAKLTIETEEGARIRVDGRPAAIILGPARSWPGPGAAAATGRDAVIELPAGRHVITISRPGRDTIARELTVERGQQLTMREPLDKSTKRKLVPWVAGVSGVLLVFTGISVGGALYYDGRASDLLDDFRRRGDRSPADAADYRTFVARRDQIRTGVYITGGAALAIGGLAAVLYWGDSPSDDGVRVTPAITSDSANLSVSGRF